MTTTKDELAAKVRELSELAAQMPAGTGKDVVNAVIGKLTATVATSLQDDGSTNPVLEQALALRSLPGPASALVRERSGEGDGILACC
jgi:hypothetical protein